MCMPRARDEVSSGQAAAVLLALVLASCAQGAGRSKGALGFGGNEWATVPDSPSLRLGQTATIELWIRPDSFGTTGKVLEKGDGADITSSRSYEIEVSPEGRPSGFGAQYFSKSPDGWTSAAAESPTPVGVWVHIAATYDATSSRAKYFINGDFAEEAAQTTTGVAIHEPLFPSEHPLTFGCVNNIGLFLRGVIDEVRIWNVIRTPQEIAAYFNRVVDPATPGLVGYWQFEEEGFSDVIRDSTAFQNHGLLGLAPSPDWTHRPARLESGVMVLSACDGELNGDYQVDDSDFVVFVQAYVLLICDDPAMETDCPADMNRDGLVDDGDFVIFGQGYDQFLCP